MTRPSPRRRRGFTLVELLIVIVIIGILVALLIPAIAAAVRTANNARVTAEINNLAGALEDFKTKYGDYPPSRIMLSESRDASYSGALSASDLTSTLAAFNKWNVGGGTIGTLPASYFGSTDVTGSTYADLTVGQLWERSQRYLRKLFPKAAPPNVNASTPFWHDYDGNGQITPGFLYLQGHECLVFFLGGIPNPGGTAIGASGFDRNPVKPFTSPLLPGMAPFNAPSYITSDNRFPPFFEFKGDRLVDEDLDGIPGYTDTLNPGPQPTQARPYAYFSAYGNNMYDPNDVNFDADESVPGFARIGRAFRVNVGTGNGATFSPAPNPYTNNDPSASASRANFLNGTSFQIISAGADANYGAGGEYNAAATGPKLPPISGAPSDFRIREGDNLTNFSPTRLD